MHTWSISTPPPVGVDSVDSPSAQVKAEGEAASAAESASAAVREAQRQVDAARETIQRDTDDARARSDDAAVQALQDKLVNEMKLGQDSIDRLRTTLIAAQQASEAARESTRKLRLGLNIRSTRISDTSYCCDTSYCYFGLVLDCIDADLCK